MRRITAILVVGLTLGACLPVTSKSPVGSTRGFKTDTALYGMWEGVTEDSKDTGFIAFIPDENGNTTAVLIDLPSSASGDWSTYAVKTTALGTYRYISARSLTTNGKPAEGHETENSFPVFYRIEADGTLTLYLIDADAAKAAIKGGKIAGEIQSGDFGDVSLTAAPRDLDDFFASGGGRKLFKKPFLVMHRVR